MGRWQRKRQFRASNEERSYALTIQVSKWKFGTDLVTSLVYNCERVCSKVATSKENDVTEKPDDSEDDDRDGEE